MYPVHWSSKVPFCYKKNPIDGELHRAKKTSSNFQSKIARIKAKFLPRWLFDERKLILFDKRKTIAINLPFSNKNDNFSKPFCEKLEFYTNGKVKFSIIWSTRKIKSLFKIKDNVKQLSCVVYHGICSCGNN